MVCCIHKSQISDGNEQMTYFYSSRSVSGLKKFDLAKMKRQGYMIFYTT